MKIDLDKFEIMYYLEGCARGSHLRQGCWYKMIRLYPKMPKEMRDFLCFYAKRDIKPIFDRVFSDGRRQFGAEYFDQFIACFDKDNRYMVTCGKDGRTETKEAYLYNGRYYIGEATYFDEEYITKAEKL